MGELIECFNGRVPVVQVAVVVLTGTLATAFVTLVGNIVTARSRARDRQHERTLKQQEKVLDQRVSRAELLLEKTTDFDRAASASFKRLVEINDALFKELSENPPERAVRISNNRKDGLTIVARVVGNELRHPESFLDRRRRLGELSAALLVEHDSVVDWLCYDAPRH